MVTVSQIEDSLKECSDYRKTRDLIDRLRQLRETRIPFLLTLGDLEEISKWKLRSQYGRVRDKLGLNSDEVVRIVTEAAFKIKAGALVRESNKLELCIRILSVLDGVGMGVASAVLGLTFPEEYCAIDFRAWKQIFGERKHFFSIADYRKYLKKVRPYSEELKRLVQEIDLGIWHLGMKSDGMPC